MIELLVYIISLICGILLVESGENKWLYPIAFIPYLNTIFFLGYGIMILL